jgi:hypothetical protein
MPQSMQSGGGMGIFKEREPGTADNTTPPGTLHLNILFVSLQVTRAPQAVFFLLYFKTMTDVCVMLKRNA